MSSWFLTTLRQAKVSPAFLVMLGACPLLAFALVQDWLGVVWLSLAVSCGVLALGLEALAIRARARAKRIQEEWPTVIESLESAMQSGLSILESVRDLAESSHLLVAADFAWLCEQCDSGVGIDEGLGRLKARLELSCCDLTIEALRVAHAFGGGGLIASLRLQAASLREYEQTLDQVLAKQGWVTGTAKVAVAAPWIIVAMLSTRIENAQAFETSAGQFLMALGLFASFVAMRLISVIGRLPLATRVFA